MPKPAVLQAAVSQQTPFVPPPSGALEMTNVVLEGGGTHNGIMFSPNGAWIAAAADVGGVRRRLRSDPQWEYLASSGANADRQVAGVAILNDGTAFALVGNTSTSGKLLEYSADGQTVSTLVSGLNVSANDFTSGDTGARPRPVGAMVLYDQTNDLVYYATEAGVGRFNRGTGTDAGIIALSGQSCRCLAHENHAVISNPAQIHVGTRTNGLQRISTPAGSPTTAKISGATVTRVEDAAYIGPPSDEAILMACHEEGLFRRSAAGTTTNVTPSQAASPGANGGAIRYLGAACLDIGATIAAAAVVVNPDSATEWVFRSLDVEAVGTGGWDSASPNLATLNAGSTSFTPTNRVLGASASGGANLTGLWCVLFDPADTTGNTLIASGTLSLYETTNFAGTLASIAYDTYNEGLSMVTVPDVFIDADGDVLFAAVDHNGYIIDGANLLTTEPTEIAVGGVPDGWGVFAVGSGANKISILCATSDTAPTSSSADVWFKKGDTIGGGWTSTGYSSDTDGMGALSAGQVPRPGGACGWDNGDGTYTFVMWGDGVGYIRSTVTVATSAWSTWTMQTSGPTTNLTTSSINQPRPLECTPDGSHIFGIQLSTGDVWRSTDGGVNFTNIATSISGAETVRKGRLVIDETDNFVAVSDNDGLFRINNAFTGTVSVTTIGGITNPGPVAVDSTGRVYCHEHGGNANRLLRWADFATAVDDTDATDIAIDTEYATRQPDLATHMRVGTVNGTERGITTYQGAGACTWTIPT